MIGRIHCPETAPMRQLLRPLARLLVLGALVMIQACVAGTSPAPDNLSLEALKNLGYTGISDDGSATQLRAGRWEGEPPEPGSALAPTLDFTGDFVARGDLDGDGHPEAVVVLDSWPGGSGVFSYVAVVSGGSGKPVNIATQLLGDRVQVRELRIEGGQLIADTVGAGPDDPACCPSMKIQPRWILKDGALQPLAQLTPPSPLTLADLGGAEWVLSRWGTDEPTAAEPAVTLRYSEGRIDGSSGCNRYGAPVKAGDGAGSIEIGPAVATRMACEEPRASTETRFLRLLPAVRQFRFAPGALILPYRLDDGSFGSLWFNATRPD